MEDLMDENPDTGSLPLAGDEHMQDAVEELSTSTSEISDIASTQISSEDTPDKAPPCPLPQRLIASRKRKAGRPPSPDLIGLANKILSVPNSPTVGCFAKLMDERMSKLEETQRNHLERIVLDALAKAAAGKLKDTSIVTDSIPQNMYSQYPQYSNSTPMHIMQPPPPSHPGPPQFPLFPSSSLLRSTPSQQYGNSESYYQEL
ncbi:uncharacterized protein ACNLHF_016684 [Anomaloglossus baeobatrachus]|uniref:uncharacterized protein LOC142302338 n=1 Tax=Anomaloglossus baeobatrachus TaxID=238106 RepID=UPI003F4FFB7A